MNKTAERLLDYVNDPEAAYWIGFLLADGHFSIGNDRGAIKVELSIKSRERLEKLKLFCNSSSNITCRIKSLKDKQYTMCFIAISNKSIINKICADLHIVSNKTKIPPSIDHLSDEVLFNLFIGFSDGDASISKRGKNRAIFSLEIDKTWLDILYLFEERILKSLYYNPNKSLVKILNSKNKNISCRIQLTCKNTLSKLKEKAIKNNLPIITKKWNNVNII